MKTSIMEFLRRGFTACGLGPMILALLYWIMHQRGVLQTLTVHEVCTGILSLSVLAFIAGGMNIVYQIERLPLMTAILIHGCVLYGSYLLTYLVNGWLERSILPILVFSAIFVMGYLVIWAIIYAIIRKKTRQLNESLKKKQQTA